MTRRSVLYVEDDPTLRGILTDMLRTSSELEVVGSVATPAEALAIAREHRIDVALLDLALGEGEITGIELGIRVRELRRTPALCFSASTSFPTTSRNFRTGIARAGHSSPNAAICACPD